MPEKTAFGTELVEEECIVDVIYGMISVKRKGSRELETLTSGTKVYVGDTICWSYKCKWEIRYS